MLNFNQYELGEELQGVIQSSNNIIYKIFDKIKDSVLSGNDSINLKSVFTKNDFNNVINLNIDTILKINKSLIYFVFEGLGYYVYQMFPTDNIIISWENPNKALYSGYTAEKAQFDTIDSTIMLSKDGYNFLGKKIEKALEKNKVDFLGYVHIDFTDEVITLKNLNQTISLSEKRVYNLFGDTFFMVSKKYKNDYKVKKYATKIKIKKIKG